MPGAGSTVARRRIRRLRAQLLPGTSDPHVSCVAAMAPTFVPSTSIRAAAPRWQQPEPALELSPATLRQLLEGVLPAILVRGFDPEER